jgi:CHAD domain-containing protein
MSYVLKPVRRVPRELERIAAKQLDLALRHLGRVGDAKSDDAVHEARRHVKKTRALMRRARPGGGRRFRRADRELRRANRLLAPIADGEAMVDTIARIGERYPRSLPPAVFGRLRAALLKREFRVDREAAEQRVLPLAAAVITRERAGIAHWDLSGRGLAAIAPGLKHSYKAARRAFAEAQRSPTDEALHRWRRRVKDLWLQMRLIGRRCGGVAADGRRLGTLDGYLGEIHNCVLLAGLLQETPFVNVAQAEQALPVVRHYEAHLLRRATALGRRQLAERPRDFIRRIRQGWRAATAPAGRAPARKAAACHRAA